MGVGGPWSRSTFKSIPCWRMASMAGRLGPRGLCRQAAETATRGGSAGGELVARNFKFSRLTEDDIAHFRRVLDNSPGALVDDPDDLEIYNVDWMGKHRGASRLALKPKTTEHVSAILKYCNERKLAVVPQGGNTGLVGGSVPVFDEIVLSTSAMNSIIKFDEISGTVVSQAGCVLEILDNHVAEHGYRMPLDLGAKGSCQIGGNVATNAGGSRFLRYGSFKSNVVGMECVLADGTILDTMTECRKDNTGYDLKQLMIGSEGTLGIITKLAIACPKRLEAVNAAMLACHNFDAVSRLLVRAKGELGEILSAFEVMDKESLVLAMAHLHGARDPMPEEEPYPFYVLIETSGSNGEHDMEKLEKFLEVGFEDELVLNGVVAQDAGQMEAFWHLREGLPEAVSKAGTMTFKYDVSLPMDHYYELVEATRKKLDASGAHVVSWGHVGDGNLHLNIASTTNHEEVRALLEPFVYEWTSEKRGSISAEHGIGLAKASMVHLSKSTTAVSLMSKVKDLFDPSGILNPYKVVTQ